LIAANERYSFRERRLVQSFHYKGRDYVSSTALIIRAFLWVCDKCFLIEFLIGSNFGEKNAETLWACPPVDPKSICCPRN
jgi:hypothetical protein